LTVELARFFLESGGHTQTVGSLAGRGRLMAVDKSVLNKNFNAFLFNMV
jgi:hypothetical protein